MPKSFDILTENGLTSQLPELKAILLIPLDHPSNVILNSLWHSLLAVYFQTIDREAKYLLSKDWRLIQ